MRDFIKLLTSLAPRAVRRAFEEITRKKHEMGQLQTKNEVLEETERLQRVAENATNLKPTFKRRLVPKYLTKVRSDDINANSEEAVIDINILYDHASAIGKTVTGHRKIQDGELARLRGGINKLAADIQGYLTSLDDETYTRFIYNQFADGRNMSKASNAAEVDPTIGKVLLGTKKKRRLHEFRGVTPTTVSVNPLTSVGETAAFSAFKPQNAVDPSKTTFWASLFMTDAPMETVYGGIDYPGVMMELIINLPFVDRINELRFEPFGQFPLSVVDILFFGDQSGWTQFNGFSSARNATLRVMEWHGEPQTAERVKFVIQQESYRIVDYLLPDALVQNQNLWSQMIDPETRLVLGEAELTDAQLRKSEFNPNYNAYLEGVRKLAGMLESTELEPYTGEEFNTTKRIIDQTAKTMAPGREDVRRLLIKRLIGEEAEPDDQNMVEMRAYEYILGAYHVEVNKTEYFKEGIYESPKYQCPGSLTEVTIDVSESHPAAGNFTPTSVEYEIELSEGRTAAVLPESTIRIEDEFMFVHPRSRLGRSRFIADGAPDLEVRASGSLLDPAEYTLAADADGRLEITINIPTFKRNTRYTISYDPDANENQHKIDIANYFDSMPVVDEFENTDHNGKVVLRRHPYIAMDIINSAAFEARGEEPGVWEFVGDVAAIHDGKYYSLINAMLNGSITAGAANITLSNVNGLPVGGGVVMINSEEITYAAVAGMVITGCVRGANASEHVDRTPVIGLRNYTPILVTVDGVEATNISSYHDGIHPAFTTASPDSIKTEYINIGNILYFNQPLPDASIVVTYNTMAEYIKLWALLRANTIQKAYTTPVINDFTFKIRHSVI